MKTKSKLYQRVEQYAASQRTDADTEALVTDVVNMGLVPLRRTTPDSINYDSDDPATWWPQAGTQDELVVAEIHGLISLNTYYAIMEALDADHAE